MYVTSLRRNGETQYRYKVNTAPAVDSVPGLKRKRDSEEALNALTDGDDAEAIKGLANGEPLLLKATDEEGNVVGAIAVVYNAGTDVRLAYHDARKCERGAIAHLRGLLEMGKLHAVMNKHNGGNGGLPHNLAVCGGITCVLFGLAEEL